MQAEKDQLSLELQEAEAKSRSAENQQEVLVEQLKMENAQLVAQQEKQATQVEKLEAEKRQLTNELQRAEQSAASRRDKDGIQQMELMQQLKDEHLRLELEKERCTQQQLQELRTQHETQICRLQETKDHELAELRAVIEGQRAAFVEAKQEKGKIRSLQRRIGALESDLKESKAATDAAVESAKNDQSKIRSLQRRIGALRAAQEASKEAVESGNQKIRSLQRRLGALESEGEDVEAWNGKIRSLQRRNGALQGELLELEAAQAAAIAEAILSKDQEIESLQSRIEALQQLLDTHSAVSIEGAAGPLAEEEVVQSLHRRIFSLEADLQRRVELEERAVKGATRAKEQEIEGLQRQMESLVKELEQKDQMEALVEEKERAIQSLQRRIDSLEVELQHQQETHKLDTENLHAQLTELNEQATAQSIACESTTRENDEEMGGSIVREFEERATTQTALFDRMLQDKDGEIQDLQIRVESLRTEVDQQKAVHAAAMEDAIRHSKLQAESLQSRIHSQETELISKEESLAASNGSQQQDVLLQLRQLEAHHAAEVAIMCSEKEKFTAVARDAVDETNRMFREKLAGMQSIIDQQRDEIELEVALNEVGTKEAAEEINDLKEKCSTLEEDLQAALEHEEEMEENFGIALTDAKEQIEELAKVHEAAMEHLKEQHDLLEEELLEALDREEELNEERELILAQNELEVSNLQSSLSRAHESTATAIREKEALCLARVEASQRELDAALSRIPELESSVESLHFQLESTRQMNQLQEDELSNLRSTLQQVRDESVADRVALFRHCLAFFETQKRNEVAAVYLQMNATVRKFEREVEAMKDEHIADMVELFRRTRNAVVDGDSTSRPEGCLERKPSSSLSETSSVLSFDQRAPSQLQPLSVIVKHPVGRPAAAVATVKLNSVETLQSPTSAFKKCKRASPKAEVEASSCEIDLAADDSTVPANDPLLTATASALSQKEEQSQDRGGKEPHIVCDDKAAFSAANANSTRVLGSIEQKKTSAVDSTAALSSPVPTSPAFTPSLPSMTPLDPRKMGKVCLDFSTPGLQTAGNIKLARTTPNISAAKAKLRAMEAKRFAASNSRNRRGTISLNTAAKGKPGCSAASEKIKKSAVTATSTASSLKQPIQRSGLVRPTSRSLLKPGESKIATARGKSRSSVVSATARRTNPMASSSLKKHTAESIASTSQSRISKTKRSFGTTKPAAEGKKTIAKPASRCFRNSSSRTGQLGTKKKSHLSQYGTSRASSLSYKAARTTAVQTPVTSARKKSSLQLAQKPSISTHRTSTPARVLPSSASKTPPKQKDLFQKLAALKVSAATPLLSTSKKLPRKRIHEDSESSTVPAELTFCLSSTKQKSDLLEQPSKRSKPDMHVRFADSHQQSRSSHATPSRKLAQRQFTPLKVGQEILDLFSPESPLLTPIKPNSDKQQATETDVRLRAAIRIQSVIRRYQALHLAKTMRELRAKQLQEHCEARTRAAVQIQSVARQSQALQLAKMMRELRAKQLQAQRELRIRAAVRIQSVVRGNQALQLAKTMREVRAKQLQARHEARIRAAVRIESFVRRNQAMHLAKMMREVRARQRQEHAHALTLQKLWRGARSREQTAALRGATLILQSVVRRFLGRLASKRKLQIKEAAITIQTCCRVLLAQKRIAKKRMTYLQLQQRKRQEATTAATHIQRVWRTQLEVRRFLCYRTSSVQVQSTWRMYLQRKKYSETRRSAVLVQAKFRGVLSCCQVKQWKTAILEQNAASKIQSGWRMHAWRLDYVGTLCAVSVIQAFVRRVVAQNRVQEYRRVVNVAAVRIQALWRAASSRQDYSWLYESVVVIQGFWRGAIQRKLGQKQRSAALQIQKYWRMVAIRVELKAASQSAVALQKLVRGFIARRRLAKLKSEHILYNSAAIVLQSHWRMVAVRVELKVASQNAVALQKLVRGFIARRKLSSLRSAFKLRSSAAIVLQSHWRMVSGRERLKAASRGAVALQTLVRGFVARRRLSTLKSAFKLRTSAAIVLQSHWRMCRYYVLAHARNRINQSCSMDNGCKLDGQRYGQWMKIVRT